MWLKPVVISQNSAYEHITKYFSKLRIYWDVSDPIIAIQEAQRR